MSKNDWLELCSSCFPARSRSIVGYIRATGYRAVHVVVQDSKPVEIQVRSTLQHLWAELSEIFSDVQDPSIKYGGGDQQTRELLATASRLVASHEALEKHQDELSRKRHTVADDSTAQKLDDALSLLDDELKHSRDEISRLLNDLIDHVKTTDRTSS